MDKIANAFNTTKKEALETLLSFLRIKSISSEDAYRKDMVRCKEKIDKLLKSKGFKTYEIETPGFPALIAEAGPEDKPELLFYAHYDVQPAIMEDGWSHDPFDPVIVENTIKCRGSSDDKGQLVGIIYGIDTYKKAFGELPCRVKLLIDGAEEIGSPGLEDAILERREDFKSDLAIVADCGRFTPERPSIIKSLRGLAYLEVFLQGARDDLHSGTFGGTIDNPGQVLGNMISALKNGKREIAIPGFYDDVIAPSQKELDQLKEVPFDEESYRKEVGVLQLAGEEQYSTLARRWLRPTLDINGITCGFQQEGSKTVLPRKASCKLSCRIVADQNPVRVLDMLERFFTELTPPTCRVSFKRHATANPVKLDLSGREAAWIMNAMKKAYGTEPLNIAEGATVPIVSTFAHQLKLKTFPIGFGRTDDKIHGPDEKFAVEDLEKEILTIAYLLAEAGR